MIASVQHGGNRLVGTVGDSATSGNACLSDRFRQGRYRHDEGEGYSLRNVAFVFLDSETDKAGAPAAEQFDVRQSRYKNVAMIDGHGHPREVRVSQREECRTDQSGGASADLIIHRGRFSGKLIAPYGLCSNAERQFRDDVSGVAA